MMDSIPPGQRIALRPPGTTSVPCHHVGTSQANLLHEIITMVSVYNARLRRMGLAARASNGLTSLHLSAHLDGSITIIHHDSPSWASTLAPSAPITPPRVAPAIYSRPIHPASRAELRAYFLRKGGDKRTAWQRFPPADSIERAQMERDLQIKRPTSADPMDRVIRAAARKRGADPNDPAFRAKIKAEQEELSAMLAEIVL